ALIKPLWCAWVGTIRCMLPLYVAPPPGGSTGSRRGAAAPPGPPSSPPCPFSTRKYLYSYFHYFLGTFSVLMYLLKAKKIGRISGKFQVGIPAYSCYLFSPFFTLKLFVVSLVKRRRISENSGNSRKILLQVRWVDVASSPPVLVHSTEARDGRHFVVAAGDGNSLITIDDLGQPWIHQMADGGRVVSSQVSFGRPLLGASCVAYDSDSGMLAVGLWPKIGEESSLPYLILKEVQHRQGRGRFRNPLEIPLGSAKAEASVPRSIVVTSARSVGLTSQSGVVVVCGLGDGRVVVWSESAEAPGWTVRVG
ncbi:hypothetical protein FOZ63_001261, partial [Perkinsus olseni]